MKRCVNCKYYDFPTPHSYQIGKGEEHRGNNYCGKAAQKLIDDLWDAGLRPSEGSGSAGCLAATQKHLKDMREIAFKKLNIHIE